MPATATAQTATDTDDIGGQLAEICERAAALILPLWRSGLAVAHKADESPVTEADQRAETLILAALARAFPNVPVIAEEEVAAQGVPSLAPSGFFLVDPLDGTKAFVRGDPHFTVNIGYVVEGRVRAGAVVSPPTGESWFTTRRGASGRRAGQAAQPIHTRPWPRGGALAVISHTVGENALAELKAKYGFQRIETMDSSIKLCRIAEGAADIYPRLGPTMEWDIAAGHAVLLNAGGSLNTLEEQTFGYGKAAQGFRNPGFVARGG